MVPSAKKTGGRGITLFTIGFAGKSAEEFFSALKQAGVRTILDVRLSNSSQLAGFTKKNDLIYFLREIGGIEYRHCVDLAPSMELFESYKRRKKMKWDDFADGFLALMKELRPDKTYRPEELDRACLLCSEPKPEDCHRRLVVEYLHDHWGNVTIEHL